jgi:hypothetical protein
MKLSSTYIRSIWNGGSISELSCKESTTLTYYNSLSSINVEKSACASNYVSKWKYYEFIQNQNTIGVNSCSGVVFKLTMSFMSQSKAVASWYNLRISS